MAENEELRDENPDSCRLHGLGQRIKRLEAECWSDGRRGVGVRKDGLAGHLSSSSGRREWSGAGRLGSARRSWADVGSAGSAELWVLSGRALALLLWGDGVVRAPRRPLLLMEISVAPVIFLWRYYRHVCACVCVRVSLCVRVSVCVRERGRERGRRDLKPFISIYLLQSRIFTYSVLFIW